MMKNESKTPKGKPILCLELLKTFSEKELDDLICFLNCKSFNTDKGLVNLLSALKKYHFSSHISNEDFLFKIYTELFQSSDSNQKLNKNQRSQLNRKMNDLMRLAELYLCIEVLKKNEAVKNELLCPILLERRQFLSYKRHLNRQRKTLEAELIKDEKYFTQQFHLELSYLDYLNYKNRLQLEDNLEAIMYNLERYYLLNKLSLYSTAWSIKNITRREYSFLKNPVQPLPDLSKYEHIPLIAIYAANIELAKTKKESFYDELLILIEKNSKVIPPLFVKQFYTSIIGYCIRQMTSGELGFEQKMFAIYKSMHEKDLLIDNGFISIDELKNVIVISCKVNEFEWATQIIEHYKKCIEKEIRVSVCNFNYGAVAFYQNNYSIALDRFIIVDKINLNYDISVKVLILKCLYETGDGYSEPTVQSFRTADRFFKNQKLLKKDVKMAYSNFIQILINLYRIRHNEGKMTKQRLKEKLEQQKVNTDKQWLLEKIAQL